MITLVGSNALGFRDDGTTVDFTHLWRDDVLQSTLALLGRETEFIPDDIPMIPYRMVSLVNLWNNNYFHDILELLGTVAMMHPDSFDFVLIKANCPKYVIEGLEMLGLGGKIMFWEGGAASVPKLISPPQARKNGYSDPKSLRALRELFRCVDCSTNGKVFVSRKDAYTRRIPDDQEDSLLPNYSHICVSGWTLSKQVLLFSATQEIGGVHGAGLTNMVWCAPGTKVTEYFTEYHNDCYEKLAESLEFSYRKVQL